MSEEEKAELRAEIVELRVRLGTIKTGLEAVIHIMDGNPQLIIPMRSLVETMLKIVVDEEQH